MRKVISLLLNLVLILTMSLTADDATRIAPQDWAFTLVEENDLFVKTDRNYTQGIKVSLLPAEVARADGEAGSFSWLPTLGFSNQFARAGFALGQSIFTPGDISIPTLLTNDRPYAGWLYFSALFHRRGTGARGAVLESLELDLGVVGPWSLAKEAQTWVHEVRSFTLPQGWRNQLRNEPGVRLKLLHAERWRLFAGNDGPNLELIPHAGLSLGTVENSAQLGGIARAGWNLPDDFGVRTIDALTSATGGYDRATPHWWGAYLYLGVIGKVVPQNIFLDGNLFHTSHRIDKELIVGDFSVGFIVTVRRAEIGFAQTVRSREFIGQARPHEFGSVFVKMKF